MFRVKLERVEAIDQDTCKVFMHPFINAEISSMVFPLEKTKFEALYRLWLTSGMYIQDVFRMLSPEHREFLLSGLTPEQWDELTSEALSDESR